MADIEYIKKIVQETNLQHAAVIMDGNRRWAADRGLPSAAGHKKGADTLRSITKACRKYGIKYLTVYAFSTENWKRAETEVSFLMKLFCETIKSEIPVFIENDIKLKFIGSRMGLSPDIIKVMENGEKASENCRSLYLQTAFNYGSQLEITDAVKKICSLVNKGAFHIEDINEAVIAENLYTAGIPNPDILIRTGGEKRISNYLLWQCAYSEIYVTDTLWPDFDENALALAIEEFKNRNRRFGR